MKNNDTVPVAAMRLRVGELVVKTNGDAAKTAPITLLSRTGDAIDHPWWGRVVHDMDGMKLAKSRVPIDWNHSDELIGTLNKFDTSTGDLVASGFLKQNPARTPDHAAIVMHDMQGDDSIPYEASINFGGDGIVVEEVPAGTQVQVNGRKMSGPITVIREWPLRGVAITPYGADQNTQSLMNTNGTITVTVRKSQPEVTMSNPNPAEVAQPEATVEATTEAKETETKTEETAPAAVVESVPAEAKEMAQSVAVEAKAHERYTKLAGDKGASAFLSGVAWDEFVFAVKVEADETIAALKKENAELKSKLLAMPTGNPAASFNTSPETNKGGGIREAIRIAGK